MSVEKPHYNTVIPTNFYAACMCGLCGVAQYHLCVLATAMYIMHDKRMKINDSLKRHISWQLMCRLQLRQWYWHYLSVHFSWPYSYISLLALTPFALHHHMIYTGSHAGMHVFFIATNKRHHTFLSVAASI